MKLTKHQNLLKGFAHEAALPTEAPRHFPDAPHRSSGWFRAVRLVFFVLLFVVAVGLGVIGFNIKHLGAIAAGMAAGKSDLESSLVLGQANDFAGAKAKADASVREFSGVSAELKQLRLGPLAYLPLVRQYQAEAGHLASGGEKLGAAMAGTTGFASDFGAVIGQNASGSFSKLPPADKRRLLGAIYGADAPLHTASLQLDEALAHFSEVKSFAWLQPVSGRISDLKEKVSASRQTLGEATPLTKLLPPLLGYPQPASFLFVLQNNDELRPTGGFIGTYGIIQARDGDFTRFETHDIYHLDMPARDKVKAVPPEPIRKYLVDKWYMRDANWSPDWPTSAEKILWFYQAENAAQPKPDPLTNFDGVIAVTPDLITELMKLTGPVTVEGTTYTSANFVDLLQYRVEKDFIRLGISNWQRKEVIAEIAKTIKEKLLDLPVERWPEMIRLLGDNMARKNILLYARNPELQSLISEQGWSGAIRQDWGDYLMAVDANLGALKTDAVMERQISYRLEQQPDGSLKAITTLDYYHKGGLDWKTSRYQSYTRLYVPLGARLLKMDGEAPGSASSGDEAGRTYFGAYVTVPPRGTAELRFEYILPRSLSDNMKKYNNYALLVQKQPGSQNTRLVVDASFNNAIKSYNPTNLHTEASEAKRLRSDGSLLIDRSFLLTF